MKKLELLAPGGNPEKFNIALSYGADAIYLGGFFFGLRKAAGNFSYREMKNSLDKAHKLNKKVYLTVNTYPKDDQMDDLEKYIKEINKFDFDALIVADLGVFKIVKSLVKIPIHISTQASVTNIYAAEFWIKQGASRIILARETSIQEAAEIYKKTAIDLEMFVHGSLCMAYSGKCIISNYVASRDANRGGCVNSCRWDYQVISKKENLENPSIKNSYLMNSKDLQAIELIPKMIEAGVQSFKIEGRMKSILYLASTITAYRKIIDSYLEKGFLDLKLKKDILHQIYKIPSRDFTESFLNNKADASSVLYDNQKPQDVVHYIGKVLKSDKNFIFLEVKNPFSKGDSLKIMDFQGNIIPLKVKWIRCIRGNDIELAKINNAVFINPHEKVKVSQVVYLD